MSQLSPSRPRARSNVTVRLARSDDNDSQLQRHNFYISADRPAADRRVPSPLTNTQIPYDRHNIAVRSAGFHPQSPYSPPPLNTAITPIINSSPSPSHQSSSPTSPSRRKASSGDKTFDSIKAAASRHALLERSREEAKSRARDERAKQMHLRPMAGSASGPQLTTGHGFPPPRLPALSSAPRHIQSDMAGKRTPSLDSTASLSQSPSTGFDAQVSALEDPHSVDIPALVAAAGSAEAAIRKLLLEKHEASKTNAQLWRLMNKQKAMMENLNKDLQRAVKDKDRYRKKLKDQLMSSASVSTIADATVRSSIADDGDDSQSPSVSEPTEDVMNLTNMSGFGNDRNDDNFNTPSYTTSSLPPTTPASSLVSPMHIKPMAAPFGDRSTPRSPRNAPGMSALKSPAFLDQRETMSPSVRPSAASSQPRLSPELIREDSDTINLAPKSNAMLPNEGFSASVDRTQAATRRGPPAPLDFSPQKPSDTAEHSGSEYADSRATSPVDRGRRDTREEDDKERASETQHHEHQDQTATSGSNKLRVDIPQPPELERDISTGNLSVTSEAYSPVDGGSPHVAQVQTYQSLNALHAQIKTPRDLEFAADTKKYVAQQSVSSPGLQVSPRPVERPGTAPNASPRSGTFSLIPTTVSASPKVAGNLLSPRGPKTPGLPQTPMTSASPQLLRADTYTSQNGGEPERPNTATTENFGDQALPSITNDPPPGLGEIYKGLMSDLWPGLLLPPQELPSIYIKVESSRLRPSRYSYMAPKTSLENPVFTLAVCAKGDNNQLWRVEKTLLALTQLDAQLKTMSNFKIRLPDRALFNGHAPARIDARRSALAKYFQVMLDTSMEEQAQSVVCAFFSSDAIGVEASEYSQMSLVSNAIPEISEQPKPKPRKDGYLTKKGKNFGGWVARYFVCDGPTLKYFEAPGGALLGAIKLQYASIGRQTAKSAQEELDEENQFRHAFLILEPKKRDKLNHVKHVLCAESDEERDAWVRCLMQHVENPEESRRPMTARTIARPESPKSPRVHKSMSDMKRHDPPQPTPPDMGQLRAVMYDSTTAAGPPVMGGNPPSPPPVEVEEKAPNTPGPTISGPTNGMKIEDAGMWGNKRSQNVLTKENKEKDHPPLLPKDKERKRSLFAFKGRSSSETTPREASISQKDLVGNGSAPRAVFGVGLAEAVDFASPIDIPVRLPAVVYRCIEYLRAHDAINEEGIFRMSGSNLVIRGLKDRFNAEGDVNLSAPGEQVYDIHAVASLLKLYLRELPSTILTRDLHLDFLTCLELDGRTKVEAFNVLVNRLPVPNRELLEQLAAFLREIVDNEAVNKMNVRNVGIVFSPTLNIPAPLISLFVTDHEKIFGAPIDVATVEKRLPQLLSSQPPSTNPSRKASMAEELRSGRMHLYPGQTSPSSEQAFMQQISAADYTTAQRMFKERYDTGYVPPSQSISLPNQLHSITSEQLTARPRENSGASEPPITPSHLAHVLSSSKPHHSFHSMKFPDPPFATSSVPLPGSSPKSVRSTSSTSTLTNGHGQQHRDSQASQASQASTTSSAARSASTLSSSIGAPAPLFHKHAMANLNDINISSSPLMGGTSPEFNRSSVFGAHNVLANPTTSAPDATHQGGRLETSLTAPAIGMTMVQEDNDNSPPMQTSASGPVGGNLNPYSPSMYSARSVGSGSAPGSSAGTISAGHTPNPYAPSHLNPFVSSVNSGAHGATARPGGGDASRSASTGSIAPPLPPLSRSGSADAERAGSLGSLGGGGGGAFKSNGTAKEEREKENHNSHHVQQLGTSPQPKEGFGRRLLRRQSGNFLVKAGLLTDKDKAFVPGGGLDGAREVRGVGLGVSSPRTGGFGSRRE